MVTRLTSELERSSLVPSDREASLPITGGPGKCNHADAVAEVMTARTGMRPVVVCSRGNNPDDPAPATALEAFTHSSAPWIVAVKMVSEGVDIRRLRVLVYATNVLAELSFRQIAGRIVRDDPANDEDYGVMVLPVDDRLGAMAERIKAEAPVGLIGPVVVSDPQWRPTPIEATAPLGRSCRATRPALPSTSPTPMDAARPPSWLRSQSATLSALARL